MNLQNKFHFLDTLISLKRFTEFVRKKKKQFYLFKNLIIIKIGSYWTITSADKYQVQESLEARKHL